MEKPIQEVTTVVMMALIRLMAMEVELGKLEIFKVRLIIKIGCWQG